MSTNNTAFVITNGNIYIERDTFAQAVYAEDGIIVAVGTNEEVLAAAPEGAQVFDANGRTVIPGFNDSHMHLYKFGELLQSIDLHEAMSKADVKRLSEEFIARANPVPGTILRGFGWNQDYFTDDSTMLTRQDLDDITTEYPLVFSRACGHIVSINTPALSITGVDENTPQIEGMQFDVDGNGMPNGIFREADSRLLGGLLTNEATADEREKILLDAMTVAAQNGITSVQTNDMHEADYNDIFALYEKVISENPILRAYHQCRFMTPDAFNAFINDGYTFRSGNAFNRVGPLKLFSDGSLGGRTAYLREPYADDPTTRGVQTLTQEQSDELVTLATENGFQVAVHAIGDAAIEQILDSYSLVCENGNPLRHGIVHVQITDEALLQRFVEHGIIAYIQPIFLHYDTSMLEDRVGTTLAQTSYAFNTLFKTGVHVSFGTDCPVEFLSPINNIYCAVTRQRLTGEPEGGYNPGERMDIYDAVDSYTAGSAYASFDEDVKGRIRPGYYADFAVLSQDIFTINPNDIVNTVVDATVVNGKVVYNR